MRKFFLLLSVCFFITLIVYAQLPDFHFWKLPSFNNKGVEFVNDLLKDSKGRIWIASQSGFFRYAGGHYLEYKKQKDTGTLIDNAVQTLCEDRRGNIWGGTAAGIFRFNPEKQTFRRYYPPVTNWHQMIENITCDNNGNIWATNIIHLLKFNESADSFEIRAVLPLYPGPSSGEPFRKNGMLISEDDKRIWFATAQGICCYDISEKKWFDQRHNPGAELFQQGHTGALTRSARGEMLYFDNYQRTIVRFDPVTFRILKRISLNKDHPTAVGGAMYETGDGKIWFSSLYNEVLVIDQQKGDSVFSINSIPKESFSLETKFFMSALQDDDGNLWLGTPDGIYISNIGKSIFKLHKLSKIINELDDHVSFRTFDEDPNDHSWWLTTINNIIIHYYPETGKYEKCYVKHAIPDKNGLLPSYVAATVFYEGKMAITSPNGAWLWQGDGLKLYPLSRYISFDLPLLPKRIAPAGPQKYFMTDGKQVILWDHFSKEYKRIEWSKGGGHDGVILDIFPKNSTGGTRYVLSGFSSLAKLDTDSIKPLYVIKNERERKSGYISSVEVDTAGNLWISNTGRGLIRFNATSGEYTHWDESNGLSYNYIDALAVDRNNNIWTDGKGYFSVWLSNQQRFFNFHIPAEKRNSSWKSFMRTLHNGHIVGNNYNTILEFFPDRLMQKPVMRLPEISSLYVGDRRILIIPETGLKFKPEENNIRISFGLLISNEVFPYRLTYKLEGIDKDWQTAENSADAVYNKLPPGEYTFRVKGRSSFGNWETGERVVTFTITKPFYATLWFFALVTASLLGLFYAFYRYRLQQHLQIFNLESKAAALEREKATIQYDSLKQQLNPHFLFNSLTSLAGLIESDQEMASGFLQSMSDMYRYILKNGGQETVFLKEELKFAKLYIDIQQTRFGKGLSVMIDVPAEYGNFKIAPVTLQNLIENAIKHNVIDPGAPLYIRIYPEEDYLIVTNNLKRKHMVETSNKTGLTQFISLYRFLSEKPVLVEETDTEFTIKVPLI
jgi:ligand-binding sensor domain-containing protein